MQTQSEVGVLLFLRLGNAGWRRLYNVRVLMVSLSNGLFTMLIFWLQAAAGITHYFFLDFPAWDRAIATACFCGLPALISARMFAETTFLDLPFCNGIFK